MDKRNWFFLQGVLEGELDGAADDIEKALDSLTADPKTFGFIYGWHPTDTTPATTAILFTKGIAYDKNGRFLRTTGDTARDIVTATDESNTDVVTGGNERWVSVFMRLGRVVSDPRTDGNGNPVDFVQDVGLNDDDTVAGEGELFVTVGVEAAAGSAVKPALDPNAVLLGDYLRAEGTTASTYDGTRREWWKYQHRLEDNVGFLPTWRLLSDIVPIDSEANGVGEDQFSNHPVSVWMNGNGGLAVTINAKWNDDTDRWEGVITGAQRAFIMKFEPNLFFFGWHFDVNTPWVDTNNSPSGWQGLLHQHVTGQGSSIFFQDGILRQDVAVAGFEQEAMSAVGGDSGATGGAMIGAFTYPTTFVSTPSTVTLSTVGADANVTSAVLTDSNRYGGTLTVTPTAIDTITRAVRRVLAR